jgi:hypothetical protein
VRQRLAPLLLAAFCTLLAASCGGESSPRDVDVSQASGPQDEVAAALDPHDPRVLLAGSNNFSQQGMRTYVSTDGGARWSSSLGPVGPKPPVPPYAGPSVGVDPWVAIDLRGREYFSFIDFGRLYVATRDGSRGPWHVGLPVDPALNASSYGGDDKDTVAVDLSSTSRWSDRVYSAWTRISFLTRPIRFSQQLLLTHSDDGGRHWSPPTQVAAASGGSGVLFASIAVAPSGDVYLAWLHDRIVGPKRGFSHARETFEGVYVARSSDGGKRFGAPVFVADAGRSSPACPMGTWKIPAVPGKTAVTSDPTVLVDQSRGRVDVVYGRYACNRTLDIRLASLDTTLSRRLADKQINPRDGATASDQFLPAAAYDRKTHDLWVCYYSTSPDPKRHAARFECQTSTNGGATFTAPTAAASTASDETRAHASLGAGRDYGDYEAVVAGDGAAHPFWTDARNVDRRGEEIYTTRLLPS